jgi:hypothetical protein
MGRTPECCERMDTQEALPPALPIIGDKVVIKYIT